MCAVFYQVRAVNIHHARAFFPRGADVIRATHDVFAIGGRLLGGRGRWIDEGFLNARHTVALGEGVDFEL